MTFKFKIQETGLNYVVAVDDTRELQRILETLELGGVPLTISEIADMPMGGGHLINSRWLREVKTVGGTLWLCLVYGEERIFNIPPVLSAAILPGFALDLPGSDDAADVVEAIILAHACEGLDVTSDVYLKGINSALEGLANNTDYD